MKPELTEDSAEDFVGLRAAFFSNDLSNDAATTARMNWLDSAAVETLQACSDDIVGLLRSQVVELVIMDHSDSLDSLQWLPLIRSIGQQNLAIVVLGPDTQDGLAVSCLAASADGFLAKNADPQLLKWTIVRALERRRLLVDSEQWRRSQSQSQVHDHQAAVHQNRALRSVLLESSYSMDDPIPPSWLVQKLKELLTVFVVSASGNLRGDVVEFASGLRQSGVTLAEVLTAHSLATEQILLGLGNRPGWHVLGRSQLLAYELMMQFSNDCESNLSDVA